MLARTPSRELTEWMAYESVTGPLGPVRGDWQAASIAHVTAVVAAGKKGKRLKLPDFLLRWKAPRKRAQSPEAQLEIFKTLAERGRRGNGNDR